ncbi:MAG: DNA-methyltransferase, partial [Alphaproteobacteria bacterium]
MTPYFEQDGVTLYHGDCREILAGLPDESVSAVVTDPPYGLAFMGKKWDYDVPAVEVWAECLRVLKPGGHLLAFAGTRTQHRMAVRIEDAGFEIRDMIAWVYGSGFPKSLDVSKAIDKAAGAKREVTGRHGGCGIKSGGGSKQMGVAAGYDAPAFTGERRDNPATEAARQWQGWGTALKPALEPITVARKPLIGTVAENVLSHGTGGLNVDGCRVGTSKNVPASVSKKAPANCYGKFAEGGETTGIGGHDPNLGRWPANLIHDGSEEVVGLFPDAGGGYGVRGGRAGATVGHFGMGATMETVGFGDTGSAARFFYTAKADKADRGPGNNHPTVKPVDLMRYMVRLVCPIGGVVLDPFSGSGTTLAAAQAEGCLAIGVEREAAYCEIIK